jgi:DNA primase
MRGSVDTIKERLDIVEVVSGYVKLEKAGASYKGRCPFHNEKTGSFFVSPERQNYYCFGCGAKGDIFTIVEELEGLDFKAALRLLGERAGVAIEYERGESAVERSEKDKIFDALEEATMFFENNLKNSTEAHEYLLQRGLTKETITSWRLGYAPNDWRTLSSHLQKLGYSKDILLKAGLIKQPEEKTNEPYDVFRDRLMFPLSDSGGRVIAFSGRALQPDAQAKYLNTPETVLFNKSEVLYGLHKAKEEIRKKNFTVLVEGQLDLVLSHQAGVKNTVASSGTAFTRAHLERLRKLSSRVLLAFDADVAGEKASEKSTLLGLSLGMEVKIARLPEGQDPADLIRISPDSWKDVLRQAQHAIEDLIGRILSKEKDQRKAGKAIEKQILPLLTLLESSIERAHFINLISKRSGIREEVLWDDLRRTPPIILDTHGSGEQKEAQVEPQEVLLYNRRAFLERKLIGIVVWQKTLPQSSIDIASLETSFRKLIGDEYFLSLLNHLENEREALLFEAESYYRNPPILSADIPELLRYLEKEILREDLLKEMRELALSEGNKNDEKVREIGQRIQIIHKRMRELE